MPLESAIVATLVVLAFVLFMGALAWAQRQSLQAGQRN